MTVRSYDPKLSTFVDERDTLIAIACRYVDNPAVAEELVQESWLRSSAKAYQPDQLPPILRQIIRNLSIDWLRRQQTERNGLAELFEAKEEAPDTERVVIARQQLRTVVRTLQRLPKRTLRAFHLRRIDSLTYKEIGRRLNVSEAGAYRLVADALVQVVMAMGEPKR
ncbi:MAG: sigma-70 family RNA polymerase sigma factor [Pseudomonadota bacterium]